MRNLAKASATRDECPDANDLAAFVEGRSSGALREEIERHLSACEDCRSASAALALATGDERDAASIEPHGRQVAAGAVLDRGESTASQRRSSAASRPARWTRPLVAAAVLAFAVGAVVLGLRLARFRGGALATASLEPRLLAAARDLERREPERYAGFDPLAWRVRPLPEAPVERGSTAELHYPRGRIEELRPTFRFDASEGEAESSITLSTADGRPLWTATARGPELAYPEGRASLEPGSKYLWSLSVNGGAARVPEGRVFEVASAHERELFAAAFDGIATIEPSDLHLLLQAGLALERGQAARAEAPLCVYLERHPSEPLAIEMLARVRAELGERGSAGERSQ